LLTIFRATAQNTHVPLQDVVAAVKTNHIQNIEQYFDDFVSITINNSQATYSHNQAQVVLHDFFEQNEVKEFSVADTGEQANVSSFMIGNYTANNGTVYMIYILMKLKNNKFLLEEIRINKQ
jgi:hypothetical protein